MGDSDKRLIWIGSCLKDLRAMPLEVRKTMGFALRVAQQGGKADHATPMTGNLRDVMEIREDDGTGSNTYRVVYTIAIGNAVYALHAFQKKSKSGKATPRTDLERIERRLKAAREHHAEHESQ